MAVVRSKRLYLFIENHQLNRAVTPIAGMLYPGGIIMMI